MFGEHIIEKRTGTPFPQAVQDRLSGHPQLVHDQARHESGAVETHPAMRENTMPVANEMGTERCNGLEPDRIGQVLVVDRKVDVQTCIGNVGYALVESTFEIDDGVDSPLGHEAPLADHG